MITNFSFIRINIDAEDPFGSGIFGCHGNAEAYATQPPDGNAGGPLNSGRIAYSAVTGRNTAADEAHLLQRRFDIDLIR